MLLEENDENSVEDKENEVVLEDGDNQSSNDSQNFQCGECGETFITEVQVNSHMKSCHTVETTEGHSDVNELMEKEIEIKNLEERNLNLTRKNVALDKEVKQLKSALSEATRAKSQLSKELNDQQELLQSTIRANAILNEEIKTKDS